MIDRHKELLSAYLDGELTGPEIDEFSRAWADDGQLEITATRYQFIGDLMRDPSLASSRREPLFMRVRAALVDEPAPARSAPEARDSGLPSAGPAAGESTVVPLTPRPKRQAAWLRPVAGLGIAAAIALASIGALRLVSESPDEIATTAPQLAQAPAGPENTGPENTGPEQAAPALSAPVFAASSGGIHWSASKPDVQRRLNQYLVNHSELSRGGVHGVLPYARVVGYRDPKSAQ